MSRCPECEAGGDPSSAHGRGFRASGYERNIREELSA
jgi:hypothetical protein